MKFFAFLRLAILALVCSGVIDGFAAAAPTRPNSSIDSDQLGTAVISRLAARFDGDIRQHGAEGLWADIQACYTYASTRSKMRKEIGQCLILDEGGKVLDDGHVLIAAKSGKTVPNKDWYRTAVFDERIKKYSQIGFGAPYGSTPFLNKNMSKFLEAVKKLN